MRERRGGRPGLSVPTVSVDVRQHWNGGGGGGGEEELGWTRRMSNIRCWASHLKSKTKQKERELVSPYLKTQSTVKVVSG